MSEDEIRNILDENTSCERNNMKNRIKTYYGHDVFTSLLTAESNNVPKYCIKNGKACAYRIRITGLGSRYRGGNSACGYLYYTGKLRKCDPRKCDKFATEISAEYLSNFAEYNKDNY